MLNCANVVGFESKEINMSTETLSKTFLITSR